MVMDNDHCILLGAIDGDCIILDCKTKQLYRKIVKGAGLVSIIGKIMLSLITTGIMGIATMFILTWLQDDAAMRAHLIGALAVEELQN